MKVVFPDKSNPGGAKDVAPSYLDDYPRALAESNERYARAARHREVRGLIRSLAIMIAGSGAEAASILLFILGRSPGTTVGDALLAWAATIVVILVFCSLLLVIVCLRRSRSHSALHGVDVAIHILRLFMGG
jgi:hypothetical protein